MTVVHPWTRRIRREPSSSSLASCSMWVGGFILRRGIRFNLYLLFSPDLRSHFGQGCGPVAASQEAQIGGLWGWDPVPASRRWRPNHDAEADEGGARVLEAEGGGGQQKCQSQRQSHGAVDKVNELVYHYRILYCKGGLLRRREWVDDLAVELLL